MLNNKILLAELERKLYNNNIILPRFLTLFQCISEICRYSSDAAYILTNVNIPKFINKTFIEIRKPWMYHKISQIYIGQFSSFLVSTHAAVRGADNNTDFSLITLLLPTFQPASGLLIP